jgi:serine/threonine-protein kinase
MIAFEFALPASPETPGVRFPSDRFTIGSGPDAQMRFDQRLVMAAHAEVMVDAKGVPWIRDLSHGQLWVNGAVVQKAPLSPGMSLRLGRLEVEVREVGTAELSLASTTKRPTPFATPPLDSTAKRPTPFQPPQRVSTSNHASQAVVQRRGDERTTPELEVRAVPTLDAPIEDETVMRSVLPEGTIIGNRYRILRKLAAGGMGEVYHAEHIELHKQFAVKVMLPTLSSDPEFVNRFKREAISASRIGQQNIIDISDFGQTDDRRFYFVMEYLDGLTIASTVHRQGPLPVERMVNIGLQTARALAAAHAQGIVHRDMKPENVMVLQRPGQADFVKVLDFGIAKVSTGPAQGGQTQLGMVVGTPQYMSPEQAMGVAVDTRTDTYALGLIFYEMLTGAPAFHGDTASILMVKQVTEPAPPFPQEVATTIPAALHDLVFHMLEKDPNARPQSLDLVVNALETLQAHLKLGAHLPPATASGRFPATATPRVLSPIRVTSSGTPVSQPQALSDRTMDEPLDPQPRSKTPMALAGVLAVAVLGGGAALFVKSTPAAKTEVVVPQPVPEAPTPTLEKLEKVEAPPTPTIAKTVKLTLESKPMGAEVFENDVLLGRTPLPVTRASGSIVELRFVLKGFFDLSRKVMMPTEDESRVFELEKKVTAVGRPKPKDELKGLDFEQTNDLKDLE